MLIYNIKTQVKFDLGYNPLIFDSVMGFLVIAHLAGASVSYGHISSFHKKTKLGQRVNTLNVITVLTLFHSLRRGCPVFLTFCENADA